MDPMNSQITMPKSAPQTKGIPKKGPVACDVLVKRPGRAVNYTLAVSTECIS